MAKFILKDGEDAFKCMDGPFKGREYKPGVHYTEVPDHETHRFGRVPEPKPEAKAEPKPEAKAEPKPKGRTTKPGDKEEG